MHIMVRTVNCLLRIPEFLNLFKYRETKAQFQPQMGDTPFYKLYN